VVNDPNKQLLPQLQEPAAALGAPRSELDMLPFPARRARPDEVRPALLESAENAADTPQDAE